MSTGNFELGAFDRALHKSLNALSQPELTDFARRLIAITTLHWFADAQ
jgi:hypothetical protein